MKNENRNNASLSTEISEQIKESIINKELDVGSRLPSELELAEQFNVGRSTIREALKRLAAQSLIRTQRGASGGAFINHIKFEEAHEQQITTSILLLSMNDVKFETACEARFALERACAQFAAHRRTNTDIKEIEKEILIQGQSNLTDEEFCASDIRLHRILVDCAKNPILSYQLAGAVEAMQPLMNMITYTVRSREKIVSFHKTIMHSIKNRDAEGINVGLSNLEIYTKTLGQNLLESYK
jgi:DNA-binding FadR family transcriptional regulator